jgi:hypothetical protein
MNPAAKAEARRARQTSEAVRRFTRLMPTLLHLDSSPMGTHSVTRHLTQTFTEQWKQANPGGKVITRDLAATPLTDVTGAWVGAAYTPPDDRTQRHAHRRADGGRRVRLRRADAQLRHTSQLQAVD